MNLIPCHQFISLTNESMTENMEVPGAQKPGNDMTPVFIVNTHGVVSCKARHIAVQLLKDRPRWRYATKEEIAAENIPEKKRFATTGGQLTEEGKKRRNELLLQEEEGLDKDVKEPEDYAMKDLHVMAKEKGIKSFGKKKEELLKLLEL